MEKYTFLFLAPFLFGKARATPDLGSIFLTSVGFVGTLLYFAIAYGLQKRYKGKNVMLIATVIWIVGNIVFYFVESQKQKKSVYGPGKLDVPPNVSQVSNVVL